MLTGSWRTNIVGYTGIASGVLGLVADVIMNQGLPKTLPEYFIFGSLIIAGIGNLLAKDAKVSNSPHPVAASDVSEVNEAKVNPAVEEPKS